MLTDKSMTSSISMKGFTPVRISARQFRFYCLDTVRFTGGLGFTEVTAIPPELLHSAGIVPKRASICCVTEFPVPPKTLSGFLPAFVTAALIRASIGQGQRGVLVSAPLTYRLQTRAPEEPAPFQMLGTSFTVAPVARLAKDQPPEDMS